MIVAVGRGEGIRVGGWVRKRVGGGGVDVGNGWFDGAQAGLVRKNVSSTATLMLFLRNERSPRISANLRESFNNSRELAKISGGKLRLHRS